MYISARKTADLIEGQIVLARCPEWNELGLQVAQWDGEVFYYDDQPNDDFHQCVTSYMSLDEDGNPIEVSNNMEDLKFEVVVYWAEKGETTGARLTKKSFDAQARKYVEFYLKQFKLLPPVGFIFSNEMDEHLVVESLWMFDDGSCQVDFAQKRSF